MPKVDKCDAAALPDSVQWRIFQTSRAETELRQDGSPVDPDRQGPEEANDATVKHRATTAMAEGNTRKGNPANRQTS
jgi:hypothetical protein